MRRPALALLLLLAACGGGGPVAGSPPLVVLSPSPSPAGKPSPSPGIEVVGSGPGAFAGNPPGGPGAPAPPATPGRPPTPEPNYDGAPLGALARPLLHPTPYTKVAVELDVGGSAAPTSGERSTLLSVIGSVTRKPVGVTGGRTFPGKGSGCWKDTELRSMATSGRVAHTGGDTAGLLFMFLDGTSCDGSGVLGLSFMAGSVAIFTAQVNSLATPTVSAAAFMQSVTTHELGHLCGLVNLVYKSKIDHEDPAHPGHSANNASVMYYAIDQGNLIQQFLQGPPLNFDGNDEADLQGLRDGTY